MAWFPVLVALVAAATIIQRRSFLRATRIPAAEFLVLFTPVLFALGLVGALVLHDVPLGGVAWNWPLIALTASYLLIAAIAQWVFYQGLRIEDVGSTGVLALVTPLVSVALAAFLFPAERDIRLWIVAGIALLALAASHLRGRHLVSREGERAVLLASTLFGIEAVFERSLLDHLSILDLYLVRTGALTVIFWAAFGLPELHSIGRQFRGVLAVALVYAVFLVGLYQSFASAGVTVTSILLLFGNVVLYLWASVVEHEPLRGRMALAGVVVLASVVYTVLVQAGLAG